MSYNELRDMRLVGMRLWSVNELFKCLGPLHRKKQHETLQFNNDTMQKNCPHTQNAKFVKGEFTFTQGLWKVNTIRGLGREAVIFKVDANLAMSYEGYSKHERCDILVFVKIGLFKSFQLSCECWNNLVHREVLAQACGLCTFFRRGVPRAFSKRLQ